MHTPDVTKHDLDNLDPNLPILDVAQDLCSTEARYRASGVSLAVFECMLRERACACAYFFFVLVFSRGLCYGFTLSGVSAVVVVVVVVVVIVIVVAVFVFCAGFSDTAAVAAAAAAVVSNMAVPPPECISLRTILTDAVATGSYFGNNMGNVSTFPGG